MSFITVHSPLAVRRQVAALTLFSLACSLLLCLSAHADSFRCGKRLVRTGDTQTQLLQRCGEPRERDSVKQAYWINGSLQNVRLDRWHYSPGNGRLAREVLLYRGEVVGIRLGER